MGNCTAETAYQQATSLTIKIQFMVRLRAVMISWLHGGVQLSGSLLVQSNNFVLGKFSAATMVVTTMLAQELATHTTEHHCKAIASIYTFITTHLTVTGHLGHVPCYLYFKFKMEVLKENTGPSHWDAGVLFTGGTLEHLLGTTFLYLMMETL